MINSADILGAKILIVDDEEYNLLLMEKTLHGAGYTSVTATLDPTKVSELCRNNRFDLILLDIKMPKMSGFKVMENLNALIKPDLLPSILVITAEQDNKQRAMALGAKDFISKPFELIEMLTRVHNILEMHILQKEIAEHREDNPALSNIIQRNIRKIIHIREQAKQEQFLQDKVANGMAASFGSMTFFYAHIVWFALWFVLNTGHLGLTPFDPYPYGFLTMVVSLEAIFLATFVLISQNLISKEAERLTDLSLHTSLLTEHELTRVLQMLHAIQSKIGISNDADSDLSDADLEMEMKPEDVLAEIRRLQRRASAKPR